MAERVGYGLASGLGRGRLWRSTGAPFTPGPSNPTRKKMTP